MSSNGNTDTAEIGKKVFDEELGSVQTPEGLARATVASADRLLGRHITPTEIIECSGWYEKVVAEFARIAKERT